MTSLICLKGKNFVTLGCDSQVTSGNVRIPFPFNKMQRIDDNLVMGAGSLGNVQQIINLALRDLRVSRAVKGSSAPVGLEELSDLIAEINFQYPLEYKNFHPFSFIIGGISSEEEPSLKSIGDDGSVLSIPTFYAEGSGREIALGILGQKYKKSLSQKDAERLAAESLVACSENDIFSNNQGQIFSLALDEKGAVSVTEYNSLTDKKKRSKEI